MSFQNCSSFTIDGGTYLAAGGNINYTIVQHCDGHHVPRILSFRRLPARLADAGSIGRSLATSNETAKEPDVLDVLECALRFTDQVIEPHSNGVFKNLKHDLSVLRLLVELTYTAFRACRGMQIGLVIRKHIESRMVHCAETLTRLHGRISALPHRSVPIWQSLGSLLHWWWMENEEPEEIASIRREIAVEVEEFGRCLSSLKSLHWIPQIATALAGNHLSSEDLNEYFRCGPPSLRHIQIEEIIVVEPLGKPLAIPIRFIDTVEEVHIYLQMGCQKTKGSRFIENNQYQLDESGTNRLVNTSKFRDYLKAGKVLEVSILFQTATMAPTECPRCRHHNISCESRKVNGWLECEACRMMFNATEVSQSKTEEVEENLQPPIACALIQETDPPEAIGAERMYIFRRLKIEIVVPSSPPSSSSEDGAQTSYVEDTSAVPGLVPTQHGHGHTDKSRPPAPRASSSGLGDREHQDTDIRPHPTPAPSRKMNVKGKQSRVNPGQLEVLRDGPTPVFPSPNDLKTRFQSARQSRGRSNHLSPRTVVDLGATRHQNPSREPEMGSRPRGGRFRYLVRPSAHIDPESDFPEPTAWPCASIMRLSAAQRRQEEVRER